MNPDACDPLAHTSMYQRAEEGVGYYISSDCMVDRLCIVLTRISGFAFRPQIVTIVTEKEG